MLHHPNIVQMYDLEKHDDLLFCVMEYVPGKSLAHIQRVYRKKGARIP
jgi:serine/threonine protein kinase